MRTSRVRRKLEAGNPVICTNTNNNTNTTDLIIVDMIGLMGFDCLWICSEHSAIDWDRLEHLIRTSAMNNTDSMIRIAKGSYSDLIRPLKLGAAGSWFPIASTKTRLGRSPRPLGSIP